MYRRSHAQWPLIMMAETSLLVDNGALGVHLDDEMGLFFCILLPFVALNEGVVISRLVGFLVICSDSSAACLGDFNRRAISLPRDLHKLHFIPIIWKSK